MLIAEDLLLLLYDDDSGKPTADATRLDTALAGAVLLELSLGGQVGIADGSGPTKAGRLVVTLAQPTGESVLDDAMTIVADAEGKKPAQVLGKLRKGLRDRLLAGLAERGVLHAEAGKVLGLFPTTRWPAVDSAHEAQVRQRLHDVLVVGLVPDERTSALTALLSAVDAVSKVVPADDRRALKKRAKEVSEGAWAADAVRKVVQDMNAAVTAAILGASSAAAAGGS